MTAVFLETPRLALRPLAAADVEGPYLKWLNDAEVCRYNSHHVFPYRREDALAYIEKMAQSTTDLVLAIVLRAESRHIGNIALETIDWVNRTAEFAIVIGEADCWGRGYAQEAAGVLMRHGFVALNLNRIHCGTPADHLPMRKLAEALGMQQEGLRRQALYKEGRYLDVVEYGLLRAEYMTLVDSQGRSSAKPTDNLAAT